MANLNPSSEIKISLNERTQAIEHAERILEQLMRSGVSESALVEQVNMFKSGLPAIRLERACTAGDGIRRIDAAQAERLLAGADAAIAAGRCVKFVPASGAATRMFKSLLAMLDVPRPLTLAELERLAAVDDAHNKSVKVDAAFTAKFLRAFRSFAFAEAVAASLHTDGYELDEILRSGDCGLILERVLLSAEQKGLDFARLPKGLIPFHRYNTAETRVRTPLQEQIAEAVNYACDTAGVAQIHFTVSPEHRTDAERHCMETAAHYALTGKTINISFSEQKRSTDTIAVTPENQPFLAEDRLHFRPAGHGALLENLNDLAASLAQTGLADIVFIKNIDNVVPDRLKGETYRFKRLLCGVLVELQERVFAALRELDCGVAGDELRAIAAFAREELSVECSKSDDETFHDETLRAALHVALNRPLRVCGMVPHEGEPGGGPFFVREGDGSLSLQIVESAQIDLANAEQRRIFESSTHFNPVDLVCAVRDYRGEPFDLLRFRNINTGFISVKSSAGKELKALELPGLWNGSMAHWNTIFMEVPASTFNPVKTVNDLLREAHQ